MKIKILLIFFISFYQLEAISDSCLLEPIHCPYMGYYNEKAGRIDTCNNNKICFKSFFFYFRHEVLSPRYYLQGISSENIDSAWKDLPSELLPIRDFFKKLHNDIGRFSLFYIENDLNYGDWEIDFDYYQHFIVIDSLFKTLPSYFIPIEEHGPSELFEAFKLNAEVISNETFPNLHFYSHYQQSWCEKCIPILDIYRKLKNDGEFRIIKSIKFPSSSNPFQLSYQVDTIFTDSTIIIGNIYDYRGKIFCSPYSNTASSDQINKVIEKNNEVSPLYPNPATDYIEISYPMNELSFLRMQESDQLSSSVRIFNVFGQEQYLSPAGGGEGGGYSSSSSQYSLLTTHYSLRIDVSSLTPGLYFVRVGGKVGKFLKY